MKIRLINENITKNYAEELLRARGITDPGKFAYPTPDCLESWSNLDNIAQGVEVFTNTLFDSAPYALVVDCDVDGYTSSAIMYQYIKELNNKKQIDWYLHSGKQHGLEDTWEKILEKGCEYSLIIIPDAGSNDKQYIEKFKCPVLVLDHHILEDTDMAPNMVLINNQTSTNYENKDLSGAGVTWQFCRAVDEKLNTSYANYFIDLAALGIDADMMSMLNYENQYIIQNGFKNIYNFFFKILLEKQAYSMGNQINPISVAFYIVPMINAMIRVGSMEEKERLFLAFIDGERLIPSKKRGAQKGAMERVAIESARECTNAKAHQDKAKEKIVGNLEQKIFKHDLLENRILFIRLDDEDDFPSELNGLVAMQLSARYKRPTIVARLNDEGYIRGSARGLNKSTLGSFKNFLNETGLFEYTAGHDNAFGISISNKNLTKLHEIANEELKNVDFGENAYDVNFVRSAKDADIEKIIYSLDEIKHTWGQGNDEPLIYIENIFITQDDVQVIGKNKDTLKFEKNGITYIKFRAKEEIEQLKQFNDIKINLVGKGNVNEWMGRYTPQLIIEDMEMMDSTLEF